MDAQLHAERLTADTREQRHHTVALSELPDGSFVLDDGAPWLVLGAELLRWTPAGYAERRPRAGDRVRVITPPSLVAILPRWRGVVPLLHPTAVASR